MDELYFRGKDRFRSNKLIRIVPVVFTVLMATVAGLSGGFAAAVSLAVVCVLAFVPAFLASWRCWTHVGPAGITTSRGGSRGRTWGWDRIRWIEVRSHGLPGSGTYSVRMTLADGRRRTLPGLETSPLYPVPEFTDKVHRLAAYWELHSVASDRVSPQALPSRRRRIGGILLALFTAGCLAGAVTLAALLPSAEAAQRAQRALPTCTGLQLTFVGEQDCSRALAMTVHAVNTGSNSDVGTTVDLLDSSANLREIDFNADTGVVRSLRPGDQVTADTGSDGSTVMDLRYQGLVAHTVDSPEYLPAGETTGLVALALGAVMGTVWLLTRRRSPYQLGSWWGPCAVPATFALGFVSMRKAVAPGPLSAGGFVLAGALLVAGELLALLVHRIRRRRLSR